MVYEKVRIIEFEATTTCNSFCPVCARFKENDHGVYLNPLVDFNQHLSIENITKILTDSCVDDNVLIFERIREELKIEKIPFIK